MQSLLHSKLCFNARTQKNVLIFFCVKVTSVKIKNHHSIILGFWTSPWLTQLTPMTQNYFFQIALFTSFPMIPISYFCKINWIFGRTFSESMSGYSAVQSKFFSIVWVRGTFKNPKWLSDGFWFLQTSLSHKKNVKFFFVCFCNKTIFWV